MPCRLPILLLCALLAGPLAAQEADVKALWETGCLWEVGDNPAKVKKAREELIALGEPALKHALTRLDTTNGLEVRCLNAVFTGWKEKGVDALIPHVAHEKPQGRRNVAEILALLDDKRAADALLKQAKVEDNDMARVAQLAPLVRWKTPGTLEVLLEASKALNDRARARTPNLLAEYVSKDPSLRLLEMLDDGTYHVADAAMAALKVAHQGTRALAVAELSDELEIKGRQPRLGVLRRLLFVAAVADHALAATLLLEALQHENACVRADAATALAERKQHTSFIDEKIDVAKELAAALGKESDSFARAALKRAIETLAETGKNQ